MARVGILSCSNCTQDTACSMSACLHDLRKRRGFFSRYTQDQPLDLVGVINCAGCPTMAAPEKIMKKVRALADFRLDALHFTYCLATLCPFRESYKKTIAKAYPDLTIVEGTHTPINAGEFKRAMRELLCPSLAVPKAMTDLVKGDLPVPGEPLKFH